jgi:hypothetical protein
MPNETLVQLREHVRQARAAHDEVRAHYDAGFREWKQDNERLIERVEIARAEQANAEAALRAAAEAHYVATGEKKPVDGVSIRETTALEYDDADAIAWAKTAMPQLVHETLDGKAFEKVAKASPTAVPFVAVTTTGKATIATELPAPVTEEAPF